MFNSVFAEFDRSMGREESAWADYNLEVSSEWLRRFSPDDWIALKKVIFGRPLYWQERCADAVGYFESLDGVEVLVAFLESPNIPVAAIAASGLENLEVSLPEAFRSRLKVIFAFFENKRSPYRGDLQRLIERVK